MMNIGCLSSFSKLVGKNFGMILQSLTLFFGLLTISVKFVERNVMAKVRKNERLRTLIGSQTNAIKNLVSKALSDYEI